MNRKVSNPLCEWCKDHGRVIELEIIVELDNGDKIYKCPHCNYSQTVKQEAK